MSAEDFLPSNHEATPPPGSPDSTDLFELIPNVDAQESTKDKKDLPSAIPTANSPPAYQSSDLLQSLNMSQWEFFPDEDGELQTFFDPTGGGCPKVIALNSPQLPAILMKLVRDRSGIISDLGKIRALIERMEAQALINPPKKLFNRLARLNNAILIDLMTPENDVVEVCPTGWKVTKCQSPMFRRFAHQLPLPIPTQGGSIEMLLEHLPLRENEFNDPNQPDGYNSAILKILTWLLAAYRTGIPTPILLLLGGQGSQKTTLTKILRSLIDPSQAPTLGTLQLDQLPLIFASNTIPCLENVSQFKKAFADILCRTVTGDALQRRKLYTNKELTSLHFMRPVIMNGICLPSHEPDFLDRVLIINKKRSESFRTLEAVEAEFHQARPMLFGAILDLLARTLEVLPTVEAATEFRMADFATFGRAVAKALGKEPNDFDSVYRSDRKGTTQDLLEAEPWVTLLIDIAHSKTEAAPWRGSSSRLLEQLHHRASELHNPVWVKSHIPKSPMTLGRKLKMLAPHLNEMGLITEFHRTAHERFWQIYRDFQDDVAATIEVIKQNIKEMNAHV